LIEPHVFVAFLTMYVCTLLQIVTDVHLFQEKKRRSTWLCL